MLCHRPSRNLFWILTFPNFKLMLFWLIFLNKKYFILDIYTFLYPCGHHNNIQFQSTQQNRKYLESMDFIGYCTSYIASRGVGEKTRKWVAIKDNDGRFILVLFLLPIYIKPAKFNIYTEKIKRKINLSFIVWSFFLWLY